jgi:hypothetical protein
MTRRSRSWIASWPAKPATGKPSFRPIQNSKFKTQNSKFSSLLHWTRRSLIPDPYSTHPPKPYGRAAPFLNAVRLYPPLSRPETLRERLRCSFGAATRTGQASTHSPKPYGQATPTHPSTQALRAGYANTPTHPSTHALGPDLPKSHYIIGFRHSRVTELWEQGDGRLAGD